MRTDSQSAFRNSNASYSMSNDLKGGMTNLSGVYGTLLPDNNMNYSVQVGNTHGGNTSSGTSGYSSLNYRGAYGNTMSVTVGVVTAARFITESVVGLLLMLMASPLDSRWATQWFWLRLLVLIMSK